MPKRFSSGRALGFGAYVGAKVWLPTRKDPRKTCSMLGRLAAVGFAQAAATLLQNNSHY